MALYEVCCEATQDLETVSSTDAETALQTYLKYYQTRNSDDEPIAAGERYSTILVRQGDAVLLKRDIIADGRGGVQQ